MDPRNLEGLKQLFTGLKRNFDGAVKAAAPVYQALCTVVPSNTTKEMYPWLGDMPEMREFLGNRVIHKLGAHKYEIENRKWELTLEILRDIVEDDKEGLYSPMATRMGERTALHPDTLLWECVNDGRTGEGYDEVAFFSASHTSLISPTPAAHPGTQANLHSNGPGPYWYLADLSSSLKPFIFQDRIAAEFTSLSSPRDFASFQSDTWQMGVRARYNVGYGLWQTMFASNRTLNEDNLEEAITAMDNFVSDQGVPLDISPTHLIVPTTLKHDARRLIAPDIIASGNAGVTNIHRGTLQILVAKRLDRS